MAGDVEAQSDITHAGGHRSTLHLKNLRKQWQILALQITATVALVWMYMEVISTYVVGSIDHTMLFQTIEFLLGSDLPLGDWMTGVGRSGLARFYVPLVLGLSFGGSMALLAFQSPKVQQRIKLGVIVGLIVLLVGRTLLSWLGGMIIGFELDLPNTDELALLQWPLMLILSLLIMFVYLLPIIMGTRGIWGLSRQAIIWSIGFTLLFLGLHAMLTFPVVLNQLGTYGEDLITLDTQVGTPTVSLLGFELVTREQFSLILIAVLMMVFQESAFGVIRHLEYAYRLPESCKRDEEYVRQMDNVLNSHLRHTGLYLGLTGLATMVAIGFHGVLLELVQTTTGSQWAEQVSESIELRLTYGVVISALLFLGVAATVRLLVPWDRLAQLRAAVTGSIRGEAPPPPEEKSWS
ncbi:MAG: hypothetical protein VX891_00940 [Candidatus Thermoplasmatota archaeon]|nr:hypothetical protein [Candidatus Thermoplasmatota archaeon]